MKNLFVVLLLSLSVLGCRSETGSTGSNPIGTQGPQGEQGEQGPVGPQGPQGIQGPQGPAGKDGIDGATGMNGSKGDKGDPGAPGKDGINGTNGTNGKDGAVGPAGPGMSRAKAYEVVSQTTTPGGGQAQAIAVCNDVDDILLGGSCEIETRTPNYSKPMNVSTNLNQPAYWQCFSLSAWNPAPNTSNIVIAHAICMAP